MRFAKDEKKKIRDAFINAHHQKEPVPVSRDFPQQVMKRIRKMEIDDNAPSYTIRFERLVWRMAPAAFCAILVLCLFIMNMNPTPEYEIAQLVGSDPITYDFLQLYGK
ncbi:MAG: hypothetical protein C4522_06190 [Desulfobacteraceae bacterium]|nr:MAG: hypothetical protein C4522_06190 [Desulfobacteraceae bacterium]